MGFQALLCTSCFRFYESSFLKEKAKRLLRDGDGLLGKRGM